VLAKSFFIRGCHTSSENGEWENGEWRMENEEKKGANRIASPWRMCDTPIVAHEEWRMGITRESTSGKNLCKSSTTNKSTTSLQR
jgi:hypothetical protein